MFKPFLSFIIWLPCIYIALFASCLYLHVNESNVIANRANDLISKLTREKKLALVKVASIQHMTRKTKPVFFEPYTVFNSLVGERRVDKSINKLLGEAVAKLKDDLNGSNLMQVNLQGIGLSKAKLWGAHLKNANLRKANFKNADLSKADLTGANLIYANLRKAKIYGADLSQANLQNADLTKAFFIKAKLNSADLRGAKFHNTNLFRTDLRNAILKGVDLSTVINITCEQIESAVIDKDTRLPDYIRITKSPSSEFNCKNLLKGKGIDLKIKNLVKTRLYAADLRNSNLSQTNLTGADLRSADLRDANLSGAQLVLSNLDNANLEGADLRGANLYRAQNVTCEQIESAIIDKDTRLPDYILLDGSPSTEFNCKNLLKE